MNLTIDKEKFQLWMKESGIKDNETPNQITERYFNEVLVGGIYKNIIQLVQQLEQTEAYENGVSISELLENQALPYFKEQ